MPAFTEITPTLEDYWRAIILFGRNVASYKFAFGLSLLELARAGRANATLEDLAEPYSRNICEHLRIADKQGTFRSSKFLDTCRKFNAGQVRQEELLEVTARRGFVNVIDAFHIVHDGEVKVRFFTDERKSKVKGISITDDLLRLAERFQCQNLPREIEARWRLVETAWELNLPRRVLSVRFEADSKLLIADDRRFERKPITSCRDALNGYQKGKCFYCFSPISVMSADDNLADVDHFFPHVLKPYGLGELIDGVWNLVLACSVCNRGENGKFMKLPELRFLERLHARNGFFIDSHHPLRETLKRQTGNTEPERRQFLQSMYKDAKELLLQNWKPEYEHEAAF